jgi:Mor family transcriptional regulator
MPRPTKASRKNRDLKIYRDYFGINEDHQKVPVAVLTRRYALSRGRVYQIIDEQVRKQEDNNKRIGSHMNDSVADAEKVAEMLSDVLGA